jgi:hypothetical protein
MRVTQGLWVKRFSGQRTSTGGFPAIFGPLACMDEPISGLFAPAVRTAETGGEPGNTGELLKGV